MSITDEIQTICDELMLFDDVMDKYEYIIELGKQLKPLDEQYKNELYRVQGCQSRVWLHPNLKDKHIYFEADSDALIVKGLVQILIRIYSGRTAAEILGTDTSELKRLGLSEIISSGRQNGIASMLKRIYSFATEVQDGK
ncbi:SufE family protein [Campylobacterota bacterium]